MTRSSSPRGGQRFTGIGAVAACVLALTLAGCGSTVDLGARGTALSGGDGLSTAGPTDTASSASGPSDVTASADPSASETPGVGGTDEPTSGPTSGPEVPGSKPISIGIVLTNTSGAGDSGFSTGESYSEEQVSRAVVTAMNKQGGIGGRQLAPVFAMTDPGASEWSTDFAAACAKLTEDNHVAAVLGYVFNYDPAFETCLTKKNIPHLNTGFNIPDAQELAKHPLHRALSVPTIDHRSMAKLQGAIEDKVLTKASKLMVVYDTCPGSTTSAEKVALPYLKRQGITIASAFQGGCSSGSASTGEAINGVPAAILKARREGVDALTILAGSEGPALAIVAIAAEAQGWHPTYIMSSLANLSALEGQVPPNQLKNVKAWGWMPAQDVRASLQPKKSAGQQRCLDLLATQKVKPTNFGDFTNAYKICAALFAYEAAVNKTQGNTDGPAVIKALDSIGSSFSNPDVLEGATLFGSGRANYAPSKMRAIVYNFTCKCFNYSGPVRPLP